jgi:hypothetical protein
MGAVRAFEDDRIDPRLLPNHIRSPKECRDDIENQVDWKEVSQNEML